MIKKTQKFVINIKQKKNAWSKTGINAKNFSTKRKMELELYRNIELEHKIKRDIIRNITCYSETEVDVKFDLQLDLELNLELNRTMKRSSELNRTVKLNLETERNRERDF
jgi:hypothetical protein